MLQMLREAGSGGTTGPKVISAVTIVSGSLLPFHEKVIAGYADGHSVRLVVAVNVL